MAGQPYVTVECPTCHNVENLSVCPLCTKPIARSDAWSQVSAMVSGPVGRVVINAHEACLAVPGTTLTALMPELCPPAADPPPGDADV